MKIIRTDLWQLLFTGLWLLVIAANTSVLAAQKMTSHTADGSGAFATGHYRDLFAEAGHSQREVSRKIKSAYKQLFHEIRKLRRFSFGRERTLLAGLPTLPTGTITMCGLKACRTE